MRYSKEDKTKTDSKKLVFNTLTKMPTISEWFVSLEGEGNSIGEPSLYIRLNGCYSAACSWCDSKYSWFADEGEQDLQKIGKDIVQEMKNKDIKRLTITGGEPLHFIDYIKDIVSWLSDLELNFEFIGIESNGNLLKQEDNVLKTLKAFNTIQLSFGVAPVLTISPKLDAVACYGNALTQNEVDDMYQKVVDNCFHYLNKDKIFFKFVWEPQGDNKNNLKFINKLKDYDLKRNHIMLMPWTPEEPHGKHIKIWRKSQMESSRKALSLGIKYSPRLHIDIEMD